MELNRHVKLNLISGHAAAVILLGALFTLGGLGGCIAANCVDGGSGSALEAYLRAYLSAAQGNYMPPSFGCALWNQLRFPFAVLLFGFTIVGTACIPAVFCVRGFLFSFSVACFCRLFGWAGMGPAAFLFGLPALLWTPVLFLLGLQGMHNSYGLMRRVQGEYRDSTKIDSYNWTLCVLCVAVLVICAALEYFALPYLVGWSAGLVL